MRNVLITNVELSKSTVSVGEAFILRVKALSQYSETVTIAADKYAGQINCGQTIAKVKILKP